MRRAEAVAIAAKLGAWSSIAAIAFVTLSPIEMRPEIAELQVEHVGAFAVVGFLAGLGYPRRMVPVLALVVVAAAGLELAQHLVPGRHGRLIDFTMKAVGGVLGLGLAAAANSWLRLSRRPTTR